MGIGVRAAAAAAVRGVVRLLLSVTCRDEAGGRHTNRQRRLSTWPAVFMTLETDALALAFKERGNLYFSRKHFAEVRPE